MEVDYTSAKGYLRGEHYYGRLVRKFFIFGGVIMLVTLPIFSQLIPFNVWVSLVAIVALGFVSGLLNPLVGWVVLLNVLVSLTAMVVFESEAVQIYHGLAWDMDTFFFLVNQVLAINFFLATYYGAKSMRGLFAKGKIIS